MVCGASHGWCGHGLALERAGNRLGVRLDEKYGLRPVCFGSRAAFRSCHGPGGPVYVRKLCSKRPCLTCIHGMIHEVSISKPDTQQHTIGLLLFLPLHSRLRYEFEVLLPCGREAWLWLGMTVVTQYACVHCVQLLVAREAPVTVQTVLTLRKAASLLVSCWLFSHHMPWQAVLGTAMVFAGGAWFSTVKPVVPRAKVD